MDDTYDLPSEPRLRNSILKERPTPPARTRSKPQKQTPEIRRAVPIKTSEIVEDKDDCDNSVVYREKMINSLDSSDTTLFYVTSPTSDENLKSKHEENNSPKSFLPKSRVESNHSPLLEPMENFSAHFSNLSVNYDEDSILPNITKDNLDKIRENLSNLKCADCDSEYPTVAILSWLLIICKKCANIHRYLTSNFLRLQSLITTECDSDFIELFHDFGNKYSNVLLEFNLPKLTKPNENSTDNERQKFIRKKYIERIYLQSFESDVNLTEDQLNKMLYENVETSDLKQTLHLIMLGANSNYSEKMFTVADHAKRHQQTKQMKIILANGGLSEFDLMKTNPNDIHEKVAYLSNKHRILKEFLTRYENDHIKIFPSPPNTDKSQRCLFEIDLNHILAICNQSVNAISLKCRLTNSSVTNVSSQCTLTVDEQTSSCEYVWIFPNELERSLWIREIIKRKYSYHQLIYSDFILLMELYIQEGINAEKQQVTAIVYSGRFVVCSDTIYDEVDLRKYSSLSYQKSEEFTGVILCLVSNRFLYLSSPIIKLLDLLYSCLRQAIKVQTLTNLNKQILTSQNVPVIVERFIYFIFEHGLLTKGIYRQAGQEAKIKQLLNECLDDPFTSTLNYENYTEHDVASALKRFLRLLDIPLLGTRQNYYAWLRSTIDNTISSEKLIQYYRALLKDLKQSFPLHYSTLRTMLIHIHSVAILSDRNGMTLSNLISTFTPCLISQTTFTSLDYNIPTVEHRKMSLDNIDVNQNENENFEKSSEFTDSPMLTKLKRNQSFNSCRLSITSISTISQFPFSSSYVHVTPSIQADLVIMTNLCKYYRQLFDITDDEISHEKKCIDLLISFTDNQYIPRKLDGTMISVYFESRADELNGYAMNIYEQETTADMVIEKLLKQVDKNDCFFWALFEVIIDQNLERPMYSCENISEVLYRYRTFLSHELNRQATFVVKLNYIQFEKERLQQRQQTFNNRTIQCEYFDTLCQRWMPCTWIFEKALLEVHRTIINTNDKTVRWKTTTNQQQGSNSNVMFNQPTLLHSWSVEDIYVYIGCDCRLVNPFDMNEYRVLTILSPENFDKNHSDISFGVSFRFIDRNQMFSWYLELVHVNGHDKWTRRAPRAMPDGVNYLPLQYYHTPSTAGLVRKKSEPFKNKLIAKSCHVATNFCKQLRK